MVREEGGQHAWQRGTCIGIAYSLVDTEVSREVDGVGAETVWGRGRQTGEAPGRWRLLYLCTAAGLIRAPMLQRPCQSWKHAARDPRPACTPSTPFPGQVLATNAGASGALGAHKNGARCDPRNTKTKRAVIPASLARHPTPFRAPHRGLARARMVCHDHCSLAPFPAQARSWMGTGVQQL